MYINNLLLQAQGPEVGDERPPTLSCGPWLTLRVHLLSCAVYYGRDPSTNVVLLEDFAAVIGLGIAAGCISLTHYTGNPLPDAVGSLLIGTLLGGVASFIIYTNTMSLVGRSDTLTSCSTQERGFYSLVGLGH